MARFIKFSIRFSCLSIIPFRANPRSLNADYPLQLTSRTIIASLAGLQLSFQHKHTSFAGHSTKLARNKTARMCIVLSLRGASPFLVEKRPLRHDAKSPGYHAVFMKVACQNAWSLRRISSWRTAPVGVRTHIHTRAHIPKGSVRSERRGLESLHEHFATQIGLRVT